MNAARFAEITAQYSTLRIGVVGDFFLDRYMLIDPSRAETSIETGLPVHNVVAVRPQAGAAGTILNNLVALGIGEIHAVGFCGDDGEGYELRRALAAQPGVILENFVTSTSRRTPVYAKPLILETGQPPRELSRFDSKNWTATSSELSEEMARRVLALVGGVDAILLMDQVDLDESGVVTRAVRQAAQQAQASANGPIVLADSRRGLQNFPPLTFKMNADELARMTGGSASGLGLVGQRATELAQRNGRLVFVTLAERGIMGAAPGRVVEHVAAFPVLGPIDIVGAGDSVSANLAAALAAGADPREAMILAMAAASVVIHQLGTSGTATVAQLGAVLAGR